jgi:streptogramin lyase
MRQRVTSTGEQAGSRITTLQPKKACWFTFKVAFDGADSRGVNPDQCLIVWFTDDAGYRWQLDQFMHLAETDDGTAH